ncbi:tyrosine-type recombinase/integrase [Pseudodesulfovibrio pelocollis]|uniref:tyrosine-type recombinase/integrase n=1 Tax=Pseudodesulfovibrio pelocollis TaxID=3051432 RepID=UPI00255A82D9|nr:tyrosine-type recombinase/integrase [Pseudodesulfovibrio sp. SB368]
MIGCRPFTDSEVRAMSAGFSGQVFEYRDRALFMLGVNSGPRVSEMLPLTIGDVVRGGRVRRYVEVMQTKTDQTRELELNRDEQHALLGLIRAHHLAGWWGREVFLFRSREGDNQPITRARAWQIINGQARRLGYDGTIGTHTMRKTFANNMYEELARRQRAGEHVDPLVELAKAGGWKTVEAASRYLSFRREHIRACKLAFEGRFGSIPCPGC